VSDSQSAACTSKKAENQRDDTPTSYQSRRGTSFAPGLGDRLEAITPKFTEGHDASSSAYQLAKDWSVM